MSTYRDPATGWLYRVQPYKGGYWVYYLDPKSSVIWKKCAPPGLHAGNATAEGEEEYLRGNAKRNGWELVTEACEGCPCPACEIEICPQAGCDGSDKGYGCMAPDEDCPSPPPGAQPSKEPPAELAPTAPSSLPEFDYSGLDADTAERLQNLARRAVEAKQRYILDMMEIVVEAHRELVQRLDKRSNQYSDSTFVSWCASIGVGRSTAYNLLQVQTLMDGSTPEEQAVLADAPAKLLYAAAKPSAPPTLVQAVKDGDITSHKQYQEAMAEIRARDKKITDLLEMSEAADRRADKAEQAAKDTARERDNALRRAAEAEKQRDGARDALQAVKMRGDKLKAENDALKAKPIEAQAVDADEGEGRARAMADELTAPLRAELEALRSRLPEDDEDAAELEIRDAYDGVIYATRVIENAWKGIRPLLTRMDTHTRGLAIQQVSNIVSKIREGLSCQ